MRKVFLVFALPAIVLLFFFGASAQSKSLPRNRHTAGSIRSAVVATELDRQRLFLQNVTARYEAVSVNAFTPYFSYEYVWKALKENRDRMSPHDSVLTPAQYIAFKKGYETLEHDVLQEFANQQLGVLVEALELNGFQVNEIEKLFARDLSRKKILLSSRGLSLEVFTLRMTALSDATEKQILDRLFPEQREKFNRQLALTRDRLVGELFFDQPIRVVRYALAYGF